MSRILSIAQAAVRLGIAERNVRRLCALGDLKATRIGSRSWAILERDLEACLKARRKSKDRRIHGK